MTRALRAALQAQAVLGMPVDYVRLSRRDASPAYLGTHEQWHDAEEALRTAAHQVDLVARGLPLVEAEGEAAFYGPKLDLQVRDGRGHDETIATVQLDFNQPERFDLTYTAADGTQQSVVMIHRGTVGSMERVTAALLERYQGRLPLWLAPEQVAVLPVSSHQHDAARALLDELLAVGLRAHLDPAGGLGARIRAARQRRVCVLAIVGPDEIDTVQVTDIGAAFRDPVQRDHFVSQLQRSYDGRDNRIPWVGPTGRASARADPGPSS